MVNDRGDRKFPKDSGCGRPSKWHFYGWQKWGEILSRYPNMAHTWRLREPLTSPGMILQVKIAKVRLPCKVVAPPRADRDSNGLTYGGPKKCGLISQWVPRFHSVFFTPESVKLKIVVTLLATGTWMSQEVSKRLVSELYPQNTLFIDRL